MVLEHRKNLVSELEERLRSLTRETSALEDELSRHKKRHLDEARAFQHKLKSCQEKEGLYEAARKANLFKKTPGTPVCKTAFRVKYRC